MNVKMAVLIVIIAVQLNGEQHHDSVWTTYCSLNQIKSQLKASFVQQLENDKIKT